MTTRQSVSDVKLVIDRPTHSQSGSLLFRLFRRRAAAPRSRAICHYPQRFRRSILVSVAPPYADCWRHWNGSVICSPCDAVLCASLPVTAPCIILSCSPQLHIRSSTPAPLRSASPLSRRPSFIDVEHIAREVLDGSRLPV